MNGGRGGSVLKHLGFRDRLGRRKEKKEGVVE
jgi:hypothetical protein